MKYYPIINISDWEIINKQEDSTSQEKYWVRSPDGVVGFIKYADKDNKKIYRKNIELISEKIASELGNALEYPCAKVDFIKGKELGVVSYNILGEYDWFCSGANLLASYIEANTDENNVFTLDFIKKALHNYGRKLYNQFLNLLVFDALIGEENRNADNWGVTISIKKGKLDMNLSPLFDNGNSLLYDWEEGKKDFYSYINESLCKVVRISNGEEVELNHFELIKLLYKKHPSLIYSYIEKLKLLTDEKIDKIIERIPSELITNEHSKYLRLFIKKRRDILLDIIK